jgi:hypothetical protein
LLNVLTNFGGRHRTVQLFPIEQFCQDGDYRKLELPGGDWMRAG